jgi:hypothetical protein
MTSVSLRVAEINLKFGRPQQRSDETWTFPTFTTRNSDVMAAHTIRTIDGQPNGNRRSESAFDH